MTRQIGFTVHGLPAAQGSKRHVGGGVMIESSKAVKPWRQDVVAAALDAIGQWEAEHGAPWETFTSPVIFSGDFTFVRPKSHYGSGRNATALKASAPDWVGKKPDLDKILRSTWDALSTAGIWRDDSLAVIDRSSKRFGSTAGVTLTVTEALS